MPTKKPIARKKKAVRRAKLESFDLSSLTMSDIDSMGAAQLREALKSSLRAGGVAAGHQDHRSHADT